MGCNCGKGRTQTTNYEVTLPDGTKKLVSGDTEANMAIARAGGGSKRRVP